MKRIFLIEDDVALSKIYKIKLEKEGFLVSVASNGEEGLRRAKSEKPDLIILDLILPGINGFEVLKRLKQDLETKDIPVIILTVLEQQEDASRGLELGAASYLFKSETALDKLVGIVKTNLPEE